MTNWGYSGFAAVRQLHRRKAVCVAGFVLAFALCFAALPLFSAPTTAVADRNYGKAPIAFEPNVGQSDPQVRFVARADGYTLFLTPAETVFLLKSAAKEDSPLSQAKSASGRGSALRLRFLHANDAAPMEGSEQLPGKVNYFRGNDPNNWRTEIPTFARVSHRGLYSGIDVVYYGNQKQLEYDFVVAPGADPRAIALSFSGAKKIKVDANGDLVISTAAGEVRMRRPLAYQQSENGERRIIAANYTLRGSHGAAIAVGKYDKRRPLTIDPILEYSTYLGGSNIDGANAIAVAQDKTAFVAGGTFSTDFPTAHPLQPNHGGPDDFSRDAFVAKLSADGSTVLYATYLGGENEDEATGIAVDTFGNAYVTGTTQSPHFPVSDTIPTINPECGGDGKCGASFNPGGLIVSNGFVVKLNTAGSALLYSSFIGYFEIVRARSIAVDANQIAYITGEVTDNFNAIVSGSTPPPPPFPITGNAAQPFFGGSQFDGFLIVISASGNSVVYCTYLGGVGEDGAKGIAVDSNRNAYVTGLTYSVNYPTTGTAYQPGNGGNGDAFFTKINTAGGPFVYSTMLGGNGLDQGNSIAVDSNGNAYVAGQSSSSTLPSLRPYGGNGDAFVAKFNPSLSGAASLLYFTYLGGSLADTAGGVAVDSNGDAYVTGSTVSSDFPVVGAVFQPQYGGGNADAFVAKVDPSGANLVYSTFLGGSNTESGNGIAVDSDGSAYVTGQTCSLDFPLTNPEQASSGGNCDAFVSKVSILNGIILNPNGLIFQSLNVGASSQPQTVTLTTGDSSVAISSITMSGANPGDFAQTTNCGATVPSGTQCTFSVTFAPTAVGLRKANLNIADSENGNPTTHVVALTGSTSTVQLSASSLTFTAQSIGTTSAPQTITVTNVGTSPLTVSGVVASSDFASSDNCTKAPLQPSTNCVINVTYSPTTSGPALGALTITDNVPGSPQVVLLNGTGMTPDFSIASDAPSETVVAGHSISFTVAVSSISGFAQSVSLTCGGNPAASVCSISPSSVTPGVNGSATATVTLSTVARTMAPTPFAPRWPRAPLAPLYVLALLVLLVFAIRLLPAPRRAFASACLLLLFPLLLMSACNGGTGMNSSGSGTPSGNYQLMITGSSGTTSHSVPVNLQVK
jgi:hypothetical protein